MYERPCSTTSPACGAAHKSLPRAALAYAPGSAGPLFCCGGRFLGHPTSAVVRWVERHRILAVFLPALLPPPIPLLPFALASGALGVSRRRFLTVFGAARSLRYSFVAWLGVTYGRRIVRLWSGSLQKWSTPLLCVFVVLLVIGVCYGIWKIQGLRKIDAAEKLALHDEASRAV